MFETLTGFERKDFVFQDNWRTIALTVGLIAGLYITLSWITTNVVGETNVVFVFFLILLAFAFGMVANVLKKVIPKLEPLPLGAISLGSSIKIAAIIGLPAVLLAWFLVGQNLTIALPLQVTYTQLVPSMDYIYKVIMSPIIEELGRAVLLLTTALIAHHFLKNWLLAILIGLLTSSLAFGIFHFLAYQQEFAFIGAAIIFGLIAGIMMITSKSVIPAIAFHYTNNQLIYSDGEPTMIIGVLVIFAAVLVFAFWKRLK